MFVTTQRRVPKPLNPFFFWKFDNYHFFSTSKTPAKYKFVSKNDTVNGYWVNSPLFRAVKAGKPTATVGSENDHDTARIKTLIDNSFVVKGAQIFNVLPKNLRNHAGSVESFKISLDEFLMAVLDQPSLPNYPVCRVALPARRPYLEL